MTGLEKEALEVFLLVRERFAAGQTHSPWTYQDVMGRIRDMIRKLENPDHHCPTGQHIRASCPCRRAA